MKHLPGLLPIITSLLFLPPRASLGAALVVFAALSFASQPAQAAVTQAWVRRYSSVVSNSFDHPLQVVRDASGNVVITGTSDDNSSGPDILTIKYSGADGSVLWQQRHRYTSSAYDRNYPQSVPVAIALDTSGNVVVAGSTENSANNSESDYYTAKYAAATGAILWEKRYYYNGGRPFSVMLDSLGNVFVTGESAIVKYALADGMLLWEKRLTNAFDHPKATAVDLSGNLTVTGSIFNGLNEDYLTTKYAALDGRILWETRYNGPSNGDDSPSAIAVDKDGNAIVTGESWTGQRLGCYTAKYAGESGNLLWERSYSGSGVDIKASPVALSADAFGNVVVTGTLFNYDTGYDYFTAKYGAVDGALLWENRYNGPNWTSNDNRAGGSNDFAQSLALDNAGNAVVTGVSTAAELLPEMMLPGYDYYTAKYAATNGALLWETRAQCRARWFNIKSVPAVVVDQSGNAIVTGPCFSEGEAGYYGHPDYFTAKYGAVDGKLVWENSYNGPAVYDVYPTAIAEDGMGNVLVAMKSEFGTYSAKYSAVNGALLWEKQNTDPAAQVAMIAADDAGNVVFTGSVAGKSSEADMKTAKYGPQGQLLWERTYNSPANGYDAAYAVALDRSSNVVVTGTSTDTNGFWFYYTAKYAAADGALLWEKRYGGPVKGVNVGRAITTDNQGNVVVTGYAIRGSSSPNVALYDYYTAKYAADDGSLLWEKRYNVSGEYNSWAGVVVDGGGNVVVTSPNDTLKYAADGAFLWARHYGGINASATDEAGNMILIGSPGTLKLAAVDGALLWAQPFDGGLKAVAVDRFGNVLVTGQSIQGIDSFVRTAGYTGLDGQLLWERTYKETGSIGNNGAMLALGRNGTIAVAGSSFLNANDALIVVYREAFLATALEVTSGSVRLTFNATAGQRYTVQRASTVTGPWTDLGTQVAPPSGMMQYEDRAKQSAFYRMIEAH